MISINNLGLSGLKTILNIQSATDSQSGSSPQLEDILQAKADSVLVSTASRSLGKTYQRLKATGNEAATSGFSKIVQSFGSDISGKAIADIAMATGQMASDDLQRYGSIAGSVSSLGNSAILAKFTSQAATAFNAGQELGRGYLNATAAIVEAEYSGNRQEVIDQKLANLSDFMSKFSELGNPAEASEASTTAFTEFANSIGAMTKGTDISAAMDNYTGPSEDNASA